MEKHSVENFFPFTTGVVDTGNAPGVANVFAIFEKIALMK
jgi:hypothetical protein